MLFKRLSVDVAGRLRCHKVIGNGKSVCRWNCCCLWTCHPTYVSACADVDMDTSTISACCTFISCATSISFRFSCLLHMASSSFYAKALCIWVIEMPLFQPTRQLVYAVNFNMKNEHYNKWNSIITKNAKTPTLTGALYIQFTEARYVPRIEHLAKACSVNFKHGVYASTHTYNQITYMVQCCRQGVASKEHAMCCE